MKKQNITLMLRAFADETRLRILNLLSRGELCVCDLMTVLNAPQSKISRHLGYLRKAGLVTGRKEGLWKHYSLAQTNSQFQNSMIQCLATCFKEVDILKRDAQRIQKLKINRERCQ